MRATWHVTNPSPSEKHPDAETQFWSTKDYNVERHLNEAHPIVQQREGVDDLAELPPDTSNNLHLELEEKKQIISTDMNKVSQSLQAETPAVSTVLEYRWILAQAQSGLNNEVKNLYGPLVYADPTHPDSHLHFITIFSSLVAVLGFPIEALMGSSTAF